ncbi:HD domain-containing phosphohydrolase [Psychrobium sp. 1_MG-2023]|uniref:HD domain-containing phosphohydrolase n=1 Tax=Psychrobium sp. 1_MG-2023 TaxID=3062624 RepID=UPI000C34669A|nr:HD domain-containing phosphohydrolase [Psychrobium sp. 1_MG-2023]MDP2561038.1 HD domain-containing phosphohydrolase [Psychrobium sp. 1_MG-2023]PKF58330.1 hypothetical protein CW748_03995 [Alteromonadales bacterium alter-6D02]
MQAQQSLTIEKQLSNRESLNTVNSQYFPLLHYAIAALLFAVYAYQVCPLLASLTPLHLALPIILVYPIRLVLFARVINNSPFQSRVRQQFNLDIALFALAAVGFTLANILTYDAPWHSSGKSLIGILLLGLFVASDLALNSERQLVKYLIANDQQLNLNGGLLSFAKKFSAMAITILVSLGVVIFLVINKDLYWLYGEGSRLTQKQASMSILLEVAVIITTMLLYTVRIIFSYTKNLNLYFSQQTQVMSAVGQGDLTQRVPVVSVDEFGLMAQGTNQMIAGLQASQDELKLTRDASILALASLAETRDNETGAHILRTQRYVKVLAEYLQHHPDFSADLDDEVIDLLYKSAPLHDVGKVGIVDSILLKPGKLTDEEFTIMKTHAQLGSDALQVAEQQMGSNSFLRYAREIAVSHHEKWDGSGYPNGLRGDDIPLSGRLMALADVYDALLSKRVYKPAFSHLQAKEIILKGDGQHFDPRVVEAFLACEEIFIDIANNFKDKH